MALLPYALRPAVVIRRKAIRSGLLGPSYLWKAVAVWVFGKGTLKKFVGKQPESLGKFRVGTGGFVRVANTKPVSRKERKRLGLTKDVLIAQAVADVEAARPGKGIRVK